MRRHACLRCPLWPFLLLLLSAPGCVTAGLWESAGEANEPFHPGGVHRAHLSEESLDLVVDYGEAGPHRVVVRLDLPTRGFWREFALHPGELAGVQEADLPTPHLVCVDSPADLGAQAWEDARPAAPEAGEGPGGGSGEAPPGPAPPRPPTLYYGAAAGKDQGIVACLRREAQDPVYLRIPARPASGLAPLAYAGAVVATPVTFAVDVVTFPVQVIVFLVILDGITSICD